MPSYKWLSCCRHVALIGVLAFSGCNSDRSGGQKTEQALQKKESADTKKEIKEIGKASWYGPGFHGKETASGETFDQKEMTAAHPSLPLGTKAEVINLENNKKVEVTINDRGPYVKDRVIDLSSSAAKKLDMKKEGVATVKITAKRPKNKHKKKRARARKKKAEVR